MNPLRALVALVLAFATLAVGCNGSGSSQPKLPLTPSTQAATSGIYFATAAPGSHSYTLTIAKGAAVSGPAIYAGGAPTSCVLAVDVRDEKGVLTDDVKVWFTSSPPHTVMGLGESMSGWPLLGNPAEHGRAYTVAQPYLVGTTPVLAEVDAGNGSSNQVLFSVNGY